MVPSSRKESFLAFIAGLANEKPRPETREEKYLDLIANRIGNISSAFSEDVFLVNYSIEFTAAEEGEYEEYAITCDKTAEEIFDAYTSGEKIVALLSGGLYPLNLTMTRGFRIDNAPVIFWTALTSADVYEHLNLFDLSHHNLVFTEIIHYAEEIQIGWETIVTRGSILDYWVWCEEHHSSESESEPDSEPDSEP